MNKNSFSEWPPISRKQENQEKDFEKIKESFSEWVEEYILNIAGALSSEERSKILTGRLFEEKFLDYGIEINSSEYTELLNLFFSKILDFSNDLDTQCMSNSIEEQNDCSEKRDVFLKNMSQLFFSSDMYFSSLGLSNELLFVTKLSQQNLLNYATGNKAFSFLAYDFNYLNDSDLENILDNFKKLDVNDKVLFLDTLARVGNITDTYAQNTRENTLKLLKKIEEENNEVIVKTFAKHHRGRLEEIYQFLEGGEGPEKNTYLKRESKIIDYFTQDEFKDEDEKIIFPQGILFANNNLDIYKVSKNKYAVYNVGLDPLGLIEDDIDNLTEDKIINILSYKKLVDNQNLLLDGKDVSGLIQYIHKPKLIYFIKEEFGVDLRELNLRDQIHFMQFLAGEDQETFDRLKILFENSEIQNENLLKSFLSTAGDFSFGENILEIAETKSPEKVNEIFEKYGEIVGEIDNIEEFLDKEFNQNEEDNSDLIKEITQDLLKKGKDLLQKALELNENEIISILKNIQAETEIFKSAFKKLSGCKEEGCSLEMARSIVLNKVKGFELKDEEIEKMKEIYSQNYPDEDGFGDNFRAALLESLNQKLNSENSEFNLVKKDGEIIGFNSFTDISDDEIIFANFNMDKKFSGSKIGSALLDETLLKKAKDKIILAVALKDSEILKHYVEDLGFEIVEDGLDFAGKEIVKIKLDKREM